LLLPIGKAWSIQSSEGERRHNCNKKKKGGGFHPMKKKIESRVNKL